MLVRQSTNTFIRVFDGKGYITNQMTRYDRVYNETGADFLQEISRQPTDISTIVNNLKSLYGDSVSFEKLSKDFIDFVQDLERTFFLVTGETEDECDRKDIPFSYSNAYVKTKITDYTQETETLVEDNTKDYMLQFDQRKPHLKSIQFELTSRCNERCIHCYIPNEKKDQGRDMTFEQFQRIIDEFSEMGGLHVTLSGGEVFMHKDFFRMMCYLREKDMEICVLSNLIALKDEQISSIKNLNVSYIQASLYSMNPVIHDTITRVKGSHEKTKAAIEKLVAADIPVQISCPIMKANKDALDAVFKYARSLQIKAFSDYVLMAEANLSTDNLKNRISIKDTEKVIRAIIENDIDYAKWVRKKRPIVENLTDEQVASQPICGVGINTCCVSENGDVYPCPGWQSYVVGNINKSSLKNIWEQSDKLKALRLITQSNFPKCLKCSARKYCSKCLERNYNEHNGNMFKISQHVCDVAFLTKKLHSEYRVGDIS